MSTVKIIQVTLQDLVQQAIAVKSAIYKAIPGSVSYWDKVAQFRSLEATIEAVKFNNNK